MHVYDEKEVFSNSRTPHPVLVPSSVLRVSKSGLVTWLSLFMSLSKIFNIFLLGVFSNQPWIHMKHRFTETGTPTKDQQCSMARTNVAIFTEPAGNNCQIWLFISGMHLYFMKEGKIMLLVQEYMSVKTTKPAEMFKRVISMILVIRCRALCTYTVLIFYFKKKCLSS